MARRFGAAVSDLDIDFAARDQPSFITRVLASCLAYDDGSAVAIEDVWALTVSQRTAWLLRLAAGYPHPAEASLELTVHCPDDACHEPLVLALPIEALLQVQQDAETHPWLNCPHPAAPVRLRRPTGNDQRRWQNAVFGTRAEGQAALLRSLAIDPQSGSADWPSDGQLPLLDAQLGEFDPLLAFSARATCPRCGSCSDFPVDLAAQALKALAAQQRRLLSQVHRLASRYHWGEAEILALSPQRRARYLDLLEAEASS